MLSFHTYFHFKPWKGQIWKKVMMVSSFYYGFRVKELETIFFLEFDREIISNLHSGSHMR